MQIPTIRRVQFRGAMTWEVDARAMAAECKPRKIPLRRKFPTKPAAENWARELIRRIEHEATNRTELRALCDHFLRSREIVVRPDTIKGYRTATGKLLAYCTSSGVVYADELNRSVVGEYTDHLRSSAVFRRGRRTGDSDSVGLCKQ